MVRTDSTNSIFFPPKNKALAKKISIESPDAFSKSIRILQRGGLTREEKSALQLAKARSRAQLQRTNLSAKERREFNRIVRIPLPRISIRKIPIRKR